MLWLQYFTILRSCISNFSLCLGDSLRQKNLKDPGFCVRILIQLTGCIKCMIALDSKTISYALICMRPATLFLVDSHFPNSPLFSCSQLFLVRLGVPAHPCWQLREIPGSWWRFTVRIRRLSYSTLQKTNRERTFVNLRPRLLLYP